MHLVIDIMPTASWVQLILGISLLLNAMSLVHRFHVSRIDKNRMRTEERSLYSVRCHVGEIAAMAPSEAPYRRHGSSSTPSWTTRDAVGRWRQSQSVLVPMGEINYHNRRSSSATSVRPPRLPRSSQDISGLLAEVPAPVPGW
jgi:hypothetical protein